MDKATNIFEFRRINMHGTLSGPNADPDYRDKYHPGHGGSLKDWFGKSKVVDEKGNPLLVYHGSSVAGIDEFDPRLAGSVQQSDWGEGIYFTPSKSSADYYAQEAALNLNDAEGDRLFDDAEKAAKDIGTTMMNKWMDLQSGRITEAQYQHLQELDKAWLDQRERFRQENKGTVYSAYLRIENPMVYQYVGITDPYLPSIAMGQGHDGIFIVHEQGEDETFTDTIEEIIVFDPDQIRLKK